ncbi:MAG TPA: shikimate kinase [Candidatus Altiarchaeales archaeon]|nr:shikimate kinase [Candidatus Altiarchaeales archaeon]
MKCTAISYGAATIINAIAIGKGAAFGIKLKTKATVRLNDSSSINARIKGYPGEDTKLIENCAKRVFRYFDVYYGADIETESEIPIAKGMKSSSAAANSVVLATIGAIMKEKSVLIPRDDTIINLGVDAAIDSNVTITGAFDDASASYFGGFVITDNEKRAIIKRGKMESLNVLMFIPDEKIYTKDVDVRRTKLLKEEIEITWKEALRGNIFGAMKINGILYSSLLKQNSEIALAALESGAIAAGLCGTGPAVAALVRENPEQIKEKWDKFKGKIIETKTNNEKARIIE